MSPDLVLYDFAAKTGLEAWESLPVLGIGRELVADSTRILRRIEQLAPGTMTGGLDERSTAEAWLWEEFADTALYPYPLAADARAPADGFWMGPRPCVADLGLFAQLHALRFPKTPFSAGEVQKRAALSRYLDRVDETTRG